MLVVYTDPGMDKVKSLQPLKSSLENLCFGKIQSNTKLEEPI